MDMIKRLEKIAELEGIEPKEFDLDGTRKFIQGHENLPDAI